MSDQELLTYAAKAAGMSWIDDCSAGLTIRQADAKGNYSFVWNPLSDDGYALRLAVKLGIALHHFTESCAAANGGRFFSELHDQDPCAAVRRAIVSAAADIGKRMP